MDGSGPSLLEALRTAALSADQLQALIALCQSRLSAHDPASPSSSSSGDSEEHKLPPAPPPPLPLPVLQALPGRPSTAAAAPSAAVAPPAPTTAASPELKLVRSQSQRRQLARTASAAAAAAQNRFGGFPHRYHRCVGELPGASPERPPISLDELAGDPKLLARALSIGLASLLNLDAQKALNDSFNESVLTFQVKFKYETKVSAAAGSGSGALPPPPASATGLAGGPGHLASGSGHGPGLTSAAAAAAAAANSSFVKMSSYCAAQFAMFRESQGAYLRGFRESLLASQLLAMSTNSRSGSSFFRTGDRRYILKSISHAELLRLLTMLPEYLAHFRQYPHSLLARYFGLYGLTRHRTTLRGGAQKSYWLVMEDVLRLRSETEALEWVFDLKGSTVGRTANPNAGEASPVIAAAAESQAAPRSGITPSPPLGAQSPLPTPSSGPGEDVGGGGAPEEMDELMATLQQNFEAAHQGRRPGPAGAAVSSSSALAPPPPTPPPAVSAAAAAPAMDIGGPECLKDNDWVRSGFWLPVSAAATLGPAIKVPDAVQGLATASDMAAMVGVTLKREFIKQLEADVNFLAQFSLMDYSLMVGIAAPHARPPRAVPVDADGCASCDAARTELRHSRFSRLKVPLEALRRNNYRRTELGTVAHHQGSAGKARRVRRHSLSKVNSNLTKDPKFRGKPETPAVRPELPESLLVADEYVLLGPSYGPDYRDLLREDQGERPARSLAPAAAAAPRRGPASVHSTPSKPPPSSSYSLSLSSLSASDRALLMSVSQRLAVGEPLDSEIDGGEAGEDEDDEMPLPQAGSAWDDADCRFVYLGIIDTLTAYDSGKKIARHVKSVRYYSQRNELSTIPPPQYADRFLKFIRSHVR